MHRSIEHLTTYIADVYFLLWCAETPVETQRSPNRHHVHPAVCFWVDYLLDFKVLVCPLYFDI